MASSKDSNLVARYWKNHKWNAKKGTWLLTLSDVYFLLYMARIRPEQIGRYKGQYGLARFGDKGPYVRGNCRFIPCEDNIQERDSVTPGLKLRGFKHTDEMREKCRKRMTGKKLSAETRARMRAAQQARRKRELDNQN